jgi:hypothetical protein
VRSLVGCSKLAPGRDHNFVETRALTQSAPALAATAPSLGSTATYCVVSSTFTDSNTAPQTIINGEGCFTTPPVTTPLIITGATVTPYPVRWGWTRASLWRI